LFLVDTNIISESRKGARANAGVLRFFRATDDDQMYIAVQTVGEIRRGVENVRGRGDAAQAKTLESWLDGVVRNYAERILDFDMECAQVWGRLMANGNHSPVDKQIAAVALIHDLTVVTRNTGDFEGCGCRLVNPFN